jgi:hypothetical protein
MVTDDGTRLEADDAQEDTIMDEDIDVENNDENTDIVSSQQLCKVCGKNLGNRIIPKDDRFLPEMFLDFYQIDVQSEPDFLPKNLHRYCFQSLERKFKKFCKNKKEKVPDGIPLLPAFVQKGQQKCTGCNKYNTGHNRASCNEVSSQKSVRKKRRQLMDLANRDQGNARSKDWLAYTEKFCKDNGEDLKDLLAFNLRRCLYREGLVTKAENLDKIMRGQTTNFDPLSHRTSWSRTICSNRSYNQYRDYWRFGRQHDKQILASPGKVDVEKFRVTQKNVF